MKSDATTDAWGRTMQPALESAMEIAWTHGRPVAVGRLHTSKRRWLWTIRTNDVEARTLDYGARWEPVAVALNRR